MIEWLASKMAVALAAILLISSVSAYFVSDREAQRRGELLNVARGLADFIDATFDLDGEVVLLVSYQNGGDLVLPQEVGGAAYTLNLRADSVILQQQGHAEIGHWSGSLHFWRWSGPRLGNATVERLDRDSDSLSLAAGEPFVLSLEKIELDDSEPFFAFARRTG